LNHASITSSNVVRLGSAVKTCRPTAKARVMPAAGLGRTEIL
jgi:hypothetical protein